MAEPAGRSRAIRLPALQHAGLQAMGVSVPWIAIEPLSVPGQEALDNPVADLPSSSSSSPVSSSRESSSGVVRKSPQVSPEGSIQTLSEPLSEPSSDPSSRTNSAQGAGQTQSRRIDRTDADIQTLGLDALVQRIQACEACALCGSRHHAVVGQGVMHLPVPVASVDGVSAAGSSETASVLHTRKPVLMVIGEAPGEQEDLQGKPFVGPSGELLDNMLSAIGCSRSDNVYITNAIKCRPPANRSPREDEIAACLPYLKRQIELVSPSVILALGRFASQTLLESSGSLMSLREQDHQLKVGDVQIPLVVTYHPAYLLRKPVDKQLAWQDLKRASALLRR